MINIKYSKESSARKELVSKGRNVWSLVNELDSLNSPDKSEYLNLQNGWNDTILYFILTI
jgi:hypothetical protein